VLDNLNIYIGLHNRINIVVLKPW